MALLLPRRIKDDEEDFGTTIGKTIAGGAASALASVPSLLLNQGMQAIGGERELGNALETLNFKNELDKKRLAAQYGILEQGNSSPESDLDAVASAMSGGVEPALPYGTKTESPMARASAPAASAMSPDLKEFTDTLKGANADILGTGPKAPAPPKVTPQPMKLSPDIIPPTQSPGGLQMPAGVKLADVPMVLTKYKGKQAISGSDPFMKASLSAADAAAQGARQAHAAGVPGNQAVQEGVRLYNTILNRIPGMGLKGRDSRAAGYEVMLDLMKGVPGLSGSAQAMQVAQAKSLDPLADLSKSLGERVSESVEMGFDQAKLPSKGGAGAGGRTFAQLTKTISDGEQALDILDRKLAAAGYDPYSEGPNSEKVESLLAERAVIEMNQDEARAALRGNRKAKPTYFAPRTSETTGAKVEETEGAQAPRRAAEAEKKSEADKAKARSREYDDLIGQLNNAIGRVAKPGSFASPEEVEAYNKKVRPLEEQRDKLLIDKINELGVQ